MTSKDTRFPDWTDVLELWMQTHHVYGACVVFHDPCGHDCLDKIIERFPGCDIGALIHAEYAILPMASEEEALTLGNTWPQEWCFVSVWFDGAMVSEN